MKLKKILALLLAMCLCLGLVACHSDPAEDPEAVRKDLAAMGDEELISVLLENYTQSAEPAVFAAEMSYVYRSGESVVASMEGTVRTTGVDRILSVTRSVGETAESLNYIYSNGICYMNTGKKTKVAAERADVAAYLTKYYPVFGNVSDYSFAGKDLLRSEDGTYSLVLFSPEAGIASSADLLSPLTAVGNATAPVEMSDFSDIYLTLIFSGDGNLIGQTLGADCKMTADGIETEGTLLLKFRITSTEPAQTPIYAPDDGDSYAEAETNPFAPTSEPETGTAGE